MRLHLTTYSPVRGAVLLFLILGSKLAFAQYEGWDQPGTLWADQNGACYGQCDGFATQYCALRNPAEGVTYPPYLNGSACAFRCGPSAWQSRQPSAACGTSCPSGNNDLLSDGLCNPNPPTPQSVDCGSIQQTWESGEIAFVPDGSSELASFCTPFYSLDDDACEDVAGYFNGHEICNDDKNSCEGNGYTYGAVSREGIDGGNNQVWTTVCIPPEFGEDIPTCDSNGVVSLVFNDNDGSGGFVCESPIEPPQESEEPWRPEEPPDPNSPQAPCSPGFNCLGDPFYQPGPGESTPPDPNSPGSEQGDDSSVSGGGTCASRPLCEGDPIQCAILWQVWNSRCLLEEQNQDDEFEEDPFDPNSYIGTAALESLGDSIIDSIEAHETEGDPLGTDASIQAGGVFGTLNSIMPNPGSCSDITWNVFGKGTFVISCASMAPLRDLLGFIVAALTLLYLVNVATQRPPS